MTTQRTDNINVLELVVNGDRSASGEVHAHKTGTLAARPAATAAQAGRFYYATDIQALFICDGTIWRHVSGKGVYDDFTRANSTTLGNADSGHAWSEAVGDTEILTNTLHAVSLTTGEAWAVVDTGGEIRSARMIGHFLLHSTAASINCGIGFKYQGPTGLNTRLYVQIYGTSNQLRLINVGTVVSTAAYTPAAGASVVLNLDIIGGQCIATVMDGTSLKVMAAFRDSTTIDTTGLTRCGVMFGSSGAGSDSCISFSAVFHG